MGCCQLCQKDAPLVEAHIIPRSFYRMPKGVHLAALTHGASGPFRRSQTGIYDRELLCLDCERKFAPIDTYAALHLFGDKDLSPAILATNKDASKGPIGAPAWLHFARADPDKICDFAVSVLWRAAASQRVEFKKIDLGRYGEACRTYFLFPGQTQLPEAIDVVLQHDMTPGLTQVGGGPYPSRLQEVRFYLFLAGGFRFLIKVDRRPMPGLLSLVSLRASRQVYSLGQDWFSTNTGRQALQELHAAHAKHGDPWRPKPR